MNSLGKIIGLDDSLDRLKDTTEEDKKRAEDEKRRIEEREGIIKVLDVIRNEIHEIKKTKISTDEMVEFFNKFNEFLNEFSHIEDYLKDSEGKTKLFKAVDDLYKFCTRFVREK